MLAGRILKSRKFSLRIRLRALFKLRCPQAPLHVGLVVMQLEHSESMKKIYHAFVYILVVTVTMWGCASSGGVGRASKGDFSSPRTAIDTFIAAGSARDVELLSQCFADNAAGEFDDLRNKTASQENLEELAEFVEGANITGVTITENQNTAVVKVEFRSRNEQIYMTRTAAGWKIVDF